MKILEINKFLYARGGADKHFLDVIELLRENDHQVAIFSMKHPKNIKSNWEKYFLSYVGYNREDSGFWQKVKGIGRMFYSLEAKRKINRLLDDFVPDVVHIHNIYHQLSPCILFEIKKRNIPIVMTVHDYKLVSPNHGLFLNGKFYQRCQKGKFYQCLFDRCVKNSYTKSFLAMLESYWHKWLGTYEKNIDLYIAPSAFLRKILIERGFDSRKIIMKAHFSEKNRNDFESNEEQAKYALYFGRISEDKGINVLIDIFNKLEIPLRLVGTPEENFEIKENNFIKYLGFMNQNKLKEEIAGAEFVVSGSKLPETFGLIALEAISLGVPFLGFDGGAFGEIVENGKEGFICQNEKEFQEAIKELWENSALREKMSKEALKKSREFSKEKYYLDLMEVFRGLKRS